MTSSFRRRNVAVRGSGVDDSKLVKQELANGVRPSPLDGRLTTSTGTRSLDGLLAGHAGLALGTSLLVEESGTTDFGGSILRYYASEGVVQGHHVHVLGLGDAWARDLPGLGELVRGARKDAVVEEVGATAGVEKKAAGLENAGEIKQSEKMRIAWRYEKLGQFGSKGMSSRKSAKRPTPPRNIARIRLSIAVGKSLANLFHRTVYFELWGCVLP